MKVESFPWRSRFQRGSFFCALTWTKLIQSFISYVHSRIWSAFCNLQISIWASKNTILDSNLPPEHWQLGADLSWCSQTPSKGRDQKHKTIIFCFAQIIYLVYTFMQFFPFCCVQCDSVCVYVLNLMFFVFSFSLGCLEAISKHIYSSHFYSSAHGWAQSRWPAYGWYSKSHGASSHSVCEQHHMVT